MTTDQAPPDAPPETRDPMTIFEEYLHEDVGVQVQKNTLTALAALGRPDALRLLVQKALSDHAVADHARRELVALVEAEAEHQEAVAAEVQAHLEHLDGQDASFNEQAYVAAARLRAAGLPIRLPKRPLFRRLEHDQALRQYLYHWKAWTERLAGIPAGLSGGFIGTLLLGLLYYGLLGVFEIDSIIVPAILAFVLTPVVASFGSQFTRPVHGRPDVLAVVLVELAAALLWGLIFGLLVYVATLTFGLSGSLWVLPTVALFFVAIRAGTFLGYGAPRRSLNRYGQTLMGAFVGITLLTFFFFQFNPAAGSEASENTRQAAMFWFLLIPIGIGLAGTFARIDSDGLDKAVERGEQALQGYPFLGKPAQYATLFVLLGLGVAIVLGARSLSGNVFKKTLTEADFETPISITVPTSRTIQLERPQRLGLILPETYLFSRFFGNLRSLVFSEFTEFTDPDFTRYMFQSPSLRLYTEDETFSSSGWISTKDALERGKHKIEVTGRETEAPYLLYAQTASLFGAGLETVQEPSTQATLLVVAADTSAQEPFEDIMRRAVATYYQEILTTDAAAARDLPWYMTLELARIFEDAASAYGDDPIAAKAWYALCHRLATAPEERLEPLLNVYASSDIYPNTIGTCDKAIAQASDVGSYYEARALLRLRLHRQAIPSLSALPREARQEAADDIQKALIYYGNDIPIAKRQLLRTMTVRRGDGSFANEVLFDTWIAQLGG